MDRSEYKTKMESLLNDQTTYTVIRKSPFKKVERELNAMLLDLKNKEKIPEKPIASYIQVMPYHLLSEDPSNIIKKTTLSDLLSLA